MSTFPGKQPPNMKGQLALLGQKGRGVDKVSSPWYGEDMTPKLIAPREELMRRGTRYCRRCQIIFVAGRWYKIAKIDLASDLVTLRPFRGWEKLLFFARRREWPRDTR